MSTFDRAALVKALETLGSAEADQTLAAAKLATSLLRDAGLGWNDSTCRPTSGPARSAPARSATAASNASCRRTSSFSWCC